ncbi:unnamed protein product [Withania somnifera]
MNSIKSKGSNKRWKKEMAESGILKKKNKCRLMKFEELPVYLQDNEFMTDYYRSQWPLTDVALSVFSWHNGTLDIRTFTGKMEMETLLNSYSSQISNPSFLGVYGDGYEASIWPWFVFLGWATICLVFISVSHLFACCSHKFTLFFWRLDYSWISIMIICSFFAPLYYTFCFGILVIITLCAPTLTTGEFRSFRDALFLVMGFSGVIPAAHAVALYFHHLQVLVALACEISMGLSYVAGAVFYITRFPERWKPGAFDLVGQSHQIFHVFVVAAALTHSIATLVIMDWRRGLSPCNLGVVE